MPDIVIASGKGGTGKTTVSTNLAAFLAENDPVALIDLDVEEPNSGLFIKGAVEVSRTVRNKMIPEWKPADCTLCGICQQVCNFHAVIKLGTEIMVFPELCHGCFACSELCPVNALPMKPVRMGETIRSELGRLTFIESRLDIGQEQAVPLIAQTKADVARDLHDTRYRIYDAPPGTSCPVIEATKDADFVILVTEPTPFGLNDLKLAVETMRELGKPLGVVINRSGIGNDAVEAYCRDEDITVLAKLPNDRLAAELYSRGECIYTALPAFRLGLEKIASFVRNLPEGKPS
ncbi:MAG: ATP-binding protein [Clostridia bacterium]|nr:ATP-binding protein [Spirochaetia bacterium]